MTTTHEVKHIEQLLEKPDLRGGIKLSSSSGSGTALQTISGTSGAGTTHYSMSSSSGSGTAGQQGGSGLEGEGSQGNYTTTYTYSSESTGDGTGGGFGGGSGSGGIGFGAGSGSGVSFGAGSGSGVGFGAGSGSGAGFGAGSGSATGSGSGSQRMEVRNLGNVDDLQELLENDAKARSGEFKGNVKGRTIAQTFRGSGSAKHSITNGSQSGGGGGVMVSKRWTTSSSSAGGGGNDDPREIDRPMSPTTRFISVSRIDEKNALVQLNDRLATILSRNSQLEQENGLLHIQLRDVNAKLNVITTELTKTFEDETNALRIMLQDARKDKLRLEMQLKKLQTDYNNAIDKLRALEDELATLSHNNKTMQSRIQTLTVDLKGRDDDHGRITREKMELVERLDKVSKDLDSVQNLYETEAMVKVELEHQLRNKEDEVAMKMQIHQHQFSELMVTRGDDANISGQLKLEYDARLADAIRQLRADCELQINSHREEQEALYQKREQSLQGQMSLLRGQLDGKGGEVGSLLVKFNQLEKRLLVLTAEKSNLEDQLRNLEKDWDGDKKSFTADRARLERLIQEMQEERFQLLTDYQQLMEIKVGLDNEITTYRRLLEREEERLGRAQAQEEERAKMALESQISPNFEIKRTVRTVTETSPEYYITSGGGSGGGGSGGGISYSTHGTPIRAGSGVSYSSQRSGGGGGGALSYSTHRSGGDAGGQGYSIQSGGGGGGSGGGATISYTTHTSGGSGGGGDGYGVSGGGGGGYGVSGGGGSGYGVSGGGGSGYSSGGGGGGGYSSGGGGGGGYSSGGGGGGTTSYNYSRTTSGGGADYRTDPQISSFRRSYTGGTGNVKPSVLGGSFRSDSPRRQITAGDQNSSYTYTRTDPGSYKYETRY